MKVTLGLAAASSAVDTAYPATLGIRKQIRMVAGSILVQPGDAHAGTVGTAFDMLSGLLMIEKHAPLDSPPTRGWRPVRALITQQVIQAAPGFDELLDITPTDGVRQLRELEAVAAEQLYPYLRVPLTMSASFPAVREVVQAESGTVAGGILLDYKTGAGAPHKTTGARAFFPSDADIFQILAYALMDDPTMDMASLRPAYAPPGMVPRSLGSFRAYWLMPQEGGH